MRRYRKDISVDTQWAKLVAAFAALKALGLITKANFMCCGGCASYAIAEQFGKSVTRYNTTGKGPRPAVGAVYFTRQGRERAEGSGHLYLSYGQLEHYEGSEVKARSAWDTEMVGKAVVKALTDVGLMWWWSGDADETIVVNVGEDAAERQAREAEQRVHDEERRLYHVYNEAVGRLNELCAVDHCGAGEAQIEAYKRALARIDAALVAITMMPTMANNTTNEQRAEA